MFDLSNVLNSAQQVKEQDNERKENRGNRKKLLYPADGTARVKLLFNPKSGIALRKIGRHHVHGTKVPCLQMFGHDCPVCKTLADIKSVKGTDLWEFKRKERGLSYAQFIDDNYNRSGEKQENIPTQGEVVLLMYPWSVYRDLQSIIAEAGANAATILATNAGKVVKLSRSKGKNNRIEYRVELDAFSEYTTAQTEDEYMQLLNELPNLNDEIVPAEITEDIRKSAQEVANKLVESYLSAAVLGQGATNANPTNLGNFGAGVQGANPGGQAPAWAQPGNIPPAPNFEQANPQAGGFNQPQNTGFNQPNGQFNQPNGQFNQPQGGQQFNQPGMQPGFTQPNTGQVDPNQQFSQPMNTGFNQPTNPNQPTGSQIGTQPQDSFQSQPAVEQVPNPTPTNPVNTGQAGQPEGNPLADGKPACFGKHGSVDPQQCLICPHEVECAN